MNVSRSLNFAISRISRTAGTCALAFALSGCFNNFVGGAVKGTASGGSIGVGSYDNGEIGGDTATLISISRVIRSAASPTESFDLVGDGSGTISSYCMDSSDSGSDSGASTCTCEYSYFRSDGSSEAFEVETAYREDNLIRCSITQLPPGLSYVDVRVHITNSDSWSNTIRFNFLTDATILNTSDPSSYLAVSRYQCKDSVYIPYAFDSSSGIYDPFLSEDPLLSYPFNFYTTNMGGALAAYVNNSANKPSNGAGWFCPAVPNDSTQGMDLTVFSITSDGGSSRIYPVSGSASDRSNFLLASRPSGVFNVPLNAYIAPNTLSGTDPAPLGYGAAPTPGSSSDTESCPDDDEVTLPDGYKWAKLWMYRASLPNRTTPVVSKMLGAGGLFCNPGSWKLNADGPIFPTCGTGGVIAESSSGNTTLADRVLYNTQECVVLDGDASGESEISGACSDNTAYSGAGCTTWGANAPDATDVGTQKADYLDYAPGSDLWMIRQGVLPANSCASSALSPDYLSLCEDTLAVPHETVQAQSDLDGGNSRYDFLFVVSPVSIMTSDIKLPTSAGKPYIPYRFYSPNDCLSSDPDAPTTPGDCDVSRKIFYSFYAYDPNSNGDAPDGDINRQPVFPVCVIQAED